MSIECLNCGKPLDVRDIEEMAPEEVNDKVLRADVWMLSSTKTAGVCVACAHGLVSVYCAALQWVEPDNRYSLAMRMAAATARLERLQKVPGPPRAVVSLCRAIDALGEIENYLSAAESKQPYVLTDGERAYLDEARAAASEVAK